MATIKIIKKTGKNEIYSLIYIVLSLILLILSLILVVLIISSDGEPVETGELDAGSIGTNGDKAVSVQNEELIDDSVYSFDLLNSGDIDKECWAVLEITDGSSVIDRVRKYVGIIEPGKKMNEAIEFTIPMGTVMLAIIPECGEVSDE